MKLWNRIGYEFVRSPFQWRIDNGAWQTVTPEQLTRDLMELQDWNEVAWLKMGQQNLALGAHKLEIKVPKGKDEKGNPARILYASDALCLYPGAFSPNGKNKPDADPRTPADLEAAKKVFALPAPPASEQAPHARRVTVPLNGQWEICRHDEDLPGASGRAHRYQRLPRRTPLVGDCGSRR